jgi:hypothetical protein
MSHRPCSVNRYSPAERLLFFILVSEVLYFGPAAVIWNEILRVRGASGGGSSSGQAGTLFSGLTDTRAWSISAGVTLQYMVMGSTLMCIGLVMGGIAFIWLPGTLPVAAKVVDTIIGPVFGAGYLATALAVALPGRSVMSCLVAAWKMMVKYPLAVGLVLAGGGALESVATLTFLPGVALDAFMLFYAAAVVRSLMDAGELESRVRGRTDCVQAWGAGGPAQALG